MGWSKLKLDEVTVRRTHLLKLRRQGVRYDDPRVEALGYSSPDSARRDLSRALQAHRDAEAAEVSIYRQQENERLDDELSRLQKLEAAAHVVLNNRHIMVNNGRVILHPDTNQPMEDDAPVLQAIDRLVKIEDARRRNSERRAKLNGLDMPVKTEVTGADGGPLALSTADPDKLAALIAATSRLDSEQPANTATSTPDEDDEDEDRAQ
ncbi:hypothetical protein ACTWJ9_33610 (plasmid) [Streptomyces sp. GDS52]|uniref:hypothetical protein n=1 Tax=Streptomyces sp. GDS52 TaxID=3406419 RepID=UPI003FCF17C3